MSKIREISYERSANLGDFESVRFAAVLTIDEGDKPASELKRLKTFIDGQIDIEVNKNSKVKRNEKGARVA